MQADAPAGSAGGSTPPFQIPVTIRRVQAVIVGLLILNLAILYRQLVGPESPSSLPGPSPTEVAPKSEVFHDQDRRFQLVLNSDWSVPGDVAPSFAIRANNVKEDFALSVFSDSKAALTALDKRYAALKGYVELSRSRLRKELVDVVETKPEARVVGGLPAVQWEFEATIDGSRFRFLQTVLETPADLVQIRLIATAQNFPAARGRLGEIVESFRLTPSSGRARD